MIRSPIRHFWTSAAGLFNNSELTLDSAAQGRYITNHMTTERTQQGETKMNRISLLAFGAILTATLAAAGQTSLPPVEQQLKVLTDKLDLTAGQQAKIKPILVKLHDATQDVIENEGLTQEERLAKVRPLRKEADRKIREILNDAQKQKLDQYEQGPHPEMHGPVTGTAPRN